MNNIDFTKSAQDYFFCYLKKIESLVPGQLNKFGSSDQEHYHQMRIILLYCLIDELSTYIDHEKRVGKRFKNLLYRFSKAEFEKVDLLCLYRTLKNIIKLYDQQTIQNQKKSVYDILEDWRLGGFNQKDFLKKMIEKIEKMVKKFPNYLIFYQEWFRLLNQEFGVEDKIKEKGKRFKSISEINKVLDKLPTNLINKNGQEDMKKFVKENFDLANVYYTCGRCASVHEGNILSPDSIDEVLLIKTIEKAISSIKV